VKPVVAVTCRYYVTSTNADAANRLLVPTFLQTVILICLRLSTKRKKKLIKLVSGLS